MNTSKSIFEICRSVNFGTIPQGDAADLYRRLNEQVTELCQSLPESAHSEAMMFFMKYAGIQLGEPLDFFKGYYRPVWSALHWLAARDGGAGTLSSDSLDNAIRGHAMAMTLHSLDDHLVDGDIPVSHLTLLIRGQAWRRMNEAIDRFCADLPGGSEIAQSLIDDYYSAITERDTPPTLDAYCELFRKQLATGLIMPLLAARKTGGNDGFLFDLRRASESFGIAWRLLDDIQDLEADMADGTQSAVYVCLGDKGRVLWDARGQSKGRSADKTSEKICALIRDASILETIAGRIVMELYNAAALAEGIGLPGLAEEYMVLARPVKE